MVDMNKLAQIYNHGQSLVKLDGFRNAKVYQLSDGRKLFISNPEGVTKKGKNGWTQISMATFAKSNRDDIFLVIYNDTNECFEFNHYLLEKVILFVDWNYEKDVRTDFQRSADHQGLKFRGKDGHVTVHVSKSNLNKIKLS